MDTITKYSGYRDKIKNLREEARNLMQGAFKEGCDKLFEENPELQSFGFRQYTPHFNDGDTCTFGVYKDEPDINGLRGWDIPYSSDRDEDIDVETGLTYGKLKELQEKVEELLYVFEDEDFLSLFGDHMIVTVTREKITTDYYEHD